MVGVECYPQHAHNITQSSNWERMVTSDQMTKKFAVKKNFLWVYFEFCQSQGHIVSRYAKVFGGQNGFRLYRGLMALAFGFDKIL